MGGNNRTKNEGKKSSTYKNFLKIGNKIFTIFLIYIF